MFDFDGVSGEGSQNLSSEENLPDVNSDCFRNVTIVVCSVEDLAQECNQWKYSECN